MPIFQKYLIIKFIHFMINTRKNRNFTLSEIENTAFIFNNRLKRKKKILPEEIDVFLFDSIFQFKIEIIE